MNTKDELEILRFQNKYLAETVMLMVNEMTRVGMSEFQPDYSEFLHLANWGYELLEKVGIDFSKIETYDRQV